MNITADEDHSGNLVLAQKIEQRLFLGGIGVPVVRIATSLGIPAHTGAQHFKRCGRRSERLSQPLPLLSPQQRWLIGIEG